MLGLSPSGRVLCRAADGFASEVFAQGESAGLIALAEVLENWNAIPDHNAWIDGIRSRHARKSAFREAMGESRSN